MKFKLNEKLKSFKHYFERTQTHKILSYYYAVFKHRLRLSLIFPRYLYGMNKIAIKSWIHKIQFKSEIPGQIMTVHYDPAIVKDVPTFVKRIEELFVGPYRLLHKINPAIVILPWGTIFQTGDFKGFVRSLDRDQRQALMNAVYELKSDERIEIVKPPLAV
ncbi:hypothetical protein EHQ76_06930 [Leptospira barantonii]|uniref:Uncharacterized protein n=1 Tax=Leptospira barantonii TaxID=2023184 RepID=A0A5F2BKB1_9LEPT|nr:hypothetical protein [Leptospira barantonii]TGM05995.1 hypothetical protein EHQ76_06930 [Leptospira barantonii]